MIGSLAFRHPQISCSLKTFGVCVTENAYCLFLKVKVICVAVENCTMVMKNVWEEALCTALEHYTVFFGVRRSKENHKIK
jgi:hypothetical protein